MSGNVESVVDPLIILETEKERTRQEELKLEQLKIRLELARMKNEFDLEIVE